MRGRRRQVVIDTEWIDPLSGQFVPATLKFDSKEEAAYYRFKLKEAKAGKVTKIEIHPRLQLIPGIVYSPDFYFEYADGRREYVDVKGMADEAQILRRKLYVWRSTQPDCRWMGVPLLWVSASGKWGVDGWIGYDKLQQIRKNERAKKKAI